MATVLDKDLARWVFASIAVYFQSIATGISLPLLVEGIDERDSEIMRADHAELRINGPFVKEVSHNCWRTWTDINILLTDRMQMSQEDAYGIMRWGGEFESAMNERIPVYKLGPDVGDDDSLLGCLTMRKGQSESVKLFHFGQINSTDRIRQSVIDGRYEMYLEMT
jgi:hypothetical protein